MSRYLTALLMMTALSVTGLSAFDTGRKPTKAAMLSLCIPGGGQVYNERMIKCAMFGGTELFLIAKLIYDDNRREYYYDKAMSATGPEYQDYERKYYRYFDRQQSDWWWLGTVVFLSTVDAYVDAHLYNFEEKKRDLHLKFEDGKAMLSLDF